MLLLMSCSKSTVTVSIHVLDESSENPDSVYITGNSKDLGNWNPKGVKMKASGGEYVCEIEVMLGQTLEYKFTLGDWESEGWKSDGNGENISISPKSDTTVMYRIERWGRAIPSSTAVGNVFQRDISDPKGILPSRRLHIYLPKNYNQEPKKRYPVLFMMDGQNLFDERFSGPMGEWGIDEYLESDTASEVIVVGVENSVNRSDEYMDLVKGEAFREWMVNHVFPIIDTAYRIDTTRRFIGGSSAGGSLAYIMRREYGTPRLDGYTTVSGALCFSPALYYQDEHIQINIIGDELGNRPWPQTPIYMDMGGKGVDSLLIRGTEMFNEHIIQNPPIVRPPFRYIVYLQDDHNEAAWRKRFPSALEWILAQEK